MLILTAGLHGLLAYGCVMGDRPAPGDYRDYFPVLTVFVLPAFLATAAAIIYGAATRFAEFNPFKVCFLAVVAMNLLTFGGLGVLSMWFMVPMLVISLFQFVYVLLITVVVYYLFVRWDDRPPAAEQAAAEDDGTKVLSNGERAACETDGEAAAESDNEGAAEK